MSSFAPYSSVISYARQNTEVFDCIPYSVFNTQTPQQSIESTRYQCIHTFLLSPFHYLLIHSRSYAAWDFCLCCFCSIHFSLLLARIHVHFQFCIRFSPDGRSCGVIESLTYNIIMIFSATQSLILRWILLYTVFVFSLYGAKFLSNYAFKCDVISFFFWMKFNFFAISFLVWEAVCYVRSVAKKNFNFLSTMSLLCSHSLNRSILSCVFIATLFLYLFGT